LPWFAIDFVTVPFSPRVLKQKFESKLNTSRVAAEDGFRIVEDRIAGSGIVPLGGSIVQNRRIVDAIYEAGNKLRMVQKVEHLRGELQLHTLGEGEILHEVDIKVVDGRVGNVLRPPVAIAP
jgi:hypothetical protein